MRDELFGDDLPVAPDTREILDLTVPYRPVALFTENERIKAAEAVREQIGECFGAAEGLVMLAQAEDILSRAKTLIKEDAIAAMPAKGPLELLGGIITPRSDRKYDYTGDSTLEKLEAEQKAIAERIKERKSFLRTVKTEVADTATGEIIKPARQLTDGISLAVTLPK